MNWSTGIWITVGVLVYVFFGLGWMRAAKIGDAFLMIEHNYPFWGFVLFLVFLALWPIIAFLYAFLQLYSLFTNKKKDDHGR